MLCFWTAFIFHQLAFLCHFFFFFLPGFRVYYVCLCPSYSWLISYPAALCSGAFLVPSPTPLVFFLSVRLHVFGPMSGRMWSVLLAAAAVVCLWRPGIGKVLDRLSRSCKDWGHLSLYVNRAPILQLVVMAKPCISSSFHLWPSSLILSGSVKKTSLSY